VDSHGHVAVATSTGGICGKLVGRVGDTPLPGEQMMYGYDIRNTKIWFLGVVYFVNFVHKCSAGS